MNKEIILSIIDNKVDTLNLSNRNISYNDFKQLLNALRLNKSLKHIILSNFKINDRNINYIKLILLLKSFQNNNSLETLDISKNYITFLDIVYDQLDIINCFNLDFLNIISNEQKEIIQSNFNIINNIVKIINKTYDVSMLIKYLQQFKYLNLSFNLIEDNTDFLIQLLKNNTTLEKLDISNNLIKKSDWIYILKDNTTLKELSILYDQSEQINLYNPILYNTIDLFDNVIKNCKHLNKLSFWLYCDNEQINSIDSITFKDINNTSITSLNIDGEFGLCASKLFNSLKNSQITELNISNYILKKYDEDSFYEMIKNINTINTLKLYNITISSNCLINVFKDLYNKPLINLSLKNIKLSDTNNYFYKEIAYLIKNNALLQHLEITSIRNSDFSKINHSGLLIYILETTKTLKKFSFNKFVSITEEDINKIKMNNKNLKIIKLK